METSPLYLEIARKMVETARRHRFLPEQLAVVPELAESEKALMLLLAGRIKEYATVRKHASLDQDEIQSLFIFVYARAAEAVTDWLGGKPFMPKVEGMFNGRTPFELEEALIDYIKARPLGDCMYGAFADWCDRNPNFCQDNDVHPVLPLLEALKWTFRIAAGMTIEFFEQKARNSTKIDEN